MSKDLNLCQFIGRLGKDPEQRYTANGGAVVNFSIACGDDYKDKKSGQKVEQTNWITVVIFGKLAEIAGEYLRKGSQVYLSGKQVTRKWEDQSGNPRYSTEIVANELQMIGGKSDSSESRPAPQRNPTPLPTTGGNAGDDEFLDTIPF